MENNKAVIKGSLQSISKHTGRSIADAFVDVDAIIIVDCSGSMTMNDATGGKQRFHLACNELARLQSTLPGKLAVVGFSDNAKFYPNGVPGMLMGGTAMDVALKFVKVADGCDIKMVLISDGEPDDAVETLDVARGFKSKIDTIYIGPEDGPGRDFLRRLSEATGGKSFQQETAELNLLGDNVRKLIGA